MPKDNRAVVIGRAHGELAPDRIEWVLVVIQQDPDPRTAFARCSERLHALAATLTIAEVTTGAVTVSEVLERRGDGPAQSTGRHEARAALTAVAPLELGGDVAAAAMQAGADQLHGPRVLTPDPAETIDALLADAVRAARRRAERIAEAAGRRLGRVISVGDHRMYDDEFDVLEGELMSRQQSGGRHAGGPPVIPRPKRLDVSVRVVFELTD